MVTTELAAAPPQATAGRARRGLPASAALCTAALTTVTAIAAAVGAIAPALVSPTRPHPTLHPTVSATLSILATNGRVLALPFLLILFRFTDSRPARLAGSALLAGMLAGNAITVGLALGRWQTRLLPYLPHLPLEWSAAGLAAGTWLHAITHRQSTTTTVRAAAAVSALLLAAAVVEVFLTPHAVPR